MDTPEFDPPGPGDIPDKLLNWMNLMSGDQRQICRQLAESGELIEKLAKQVEHLDVMLHETQQDCSVMRKFIDANRGHLEQALDILHNPVKTWLDRNKAKKKVTGDAG